VVIDVPLTSGALLEAAARLLSGAGVPEARREAARLAEAAWGLGPGQARVQADQERSHQEGERLLALAGRRTRGEPLAHVTGSAGFRRLDLASDGRALIPRPETEGLVGLVLERMDRGVVADIGTGSGCIALSLAQEGNYDRVLGIDCSGEALDLARANAARTGLVVEWRLGDLVEPLRGESVDVLVANPPYLTGDEYEGLDAAVRDWEPRLALESGPDGLDVTRRLLEAGAAVVRPGGWMALEVDCERAAAVAGLAAGFGWTAPAVYRDLYDRARYVLARRSETS